MLCKMKATVGSASEPPRLLRSLLSEIKSTARQFLQNTRAYNAVLSMACVEESWVAGVLEALGITPTIAMHGRSYHYVGSELPATRRARALLAVYNHDTDYDTHCRARSE